MTYIESPSSSRLRCFIISPIGQPNTDIREDADAVLNYIVKPALERIQSEGGPIIEAIRSDQIGTPGRIEEQMLEAILTYNFCIVDLSGLNPNVLYELAIAQAAGRPVVILCRSGEMLPFDVKDYRTISYDLKPKSIKEDRWVSPLIEQILAVLAPEYSAPALLKGYDQVREGTRSYLLNSQSKEFGSTPRFTDIVERAERRCDLMGISLTSWNLSGSRDVLNDLGKRNVPVRILTMDPDNPAFDHLINEELAQSVSSVKQTASRMAEFFRELGCKHRSFEARKIRKGIPHVQLIIADRAALVLQYMFGRASAESPLIQVPYGTELYKAFTEEFEVLWALNAPKASSDQVAF